MKKIRLFMKKTFKSQKGEGYVDTGVKILIAVVIGALVLTSLYGLFNTTVMPSVKSKVESMFDYSGNGNAEGGGLNQEDEECYPLTSCYDIYVDNGYCIIQTLGNTVDSEKFEEMYIDDTLLKPDNYTIADYPGTFINLSQDFAKTLSFGSHTAKLVFDDGYATGTFNVINYIKFSIDGNVINCVNEGSTFDEWFETTKSSEDSNCIVYRKKGDSKIYSDVFFESYLSGVTWDSVIEKDKNYTSAS